MSQYLPTFLDKLPNCEQFLKNKHILFDTNVIINILEEFKATELLDYLKSLNTTFTVIHPIVVELQNTNSAKKRTDRQLLINDYQFVTLPLTRKEFDGARNIQIWLSNLNCFPSPTDLYLGGLLYRYDKSILLATSNLSDFPFPLFNRKCHIILQNNKRSHSVSFLSIDKTQLAIA